MSPVSRGRKQPKRRGSGQRVLRVVPDVPETCDCPVCSSSSEDLIGSLLASAEELLSIDDPIEAELLGATFLAAAELMGDDFTEAYANGIVPAVADAGTPAAQAVLLAFHALLPALPTREITGVPAPIWREELAAPVRAVRCEEFADPFGEHSILLCVFERAARAYAFLLFADHTDCSAAYEILLVPGEEIEEVVESIHANARQDKISITHETLDPAEMRWRLEHALAARAVHDDELTDEELAEDFEEGDGVGYHPLAVVLRSRIRAALPEPTRPPAPHGDDETDIGTAELDDLVGSLRRITEAGSRKARKLPPKRKKSDGPAPILQIKVTLKGTKPPIWRRLEVPGDITLAALHDTIQSAFDWDDSHMHVFETAYGEFGIPDPDLGYRSEKPVTLEQVTDGKVVYTYDMGDAWEHEITVEKTVDRKDVVYPRCTGGRRAAPPDDSGGVWGYANLVEILADPRHPEHRDRLLWMGLKKGTDFDPAAFSVADVNRALLGDR